MLELSKNIGLQNRKVLYILEKEDINVYLSARNLKKPSIINIRDLSTYVIMNAHDLVFLESSLSKVEEVFA